MSIEINTMAKYISILRGINVVGKKIIKMNDLKKSYEKLNFIDVVTYIQSGNVIFHYKTEKTEALENLIYSRIKTDFNLEVSVIVLTPEKLHEIIKSNPFKDDSSKDISFLHVTFLKGTPGNFNWQSITEKITGDEEVAFTNEAVFLYCPHGYGKSKLNNNFLEKILKVPATTRNWKTTIKLQELAIN